jgi:hypothetical protein
MKCTKKLLVFSFCIMNMMCFGQMLNKNYVWNDLEVLNTTCKSSECSESSLRYYHFYHIGNDTIINNITYGILIDTLHAPQSNSEINVSGSIVGFVREDVAKKKVYFLDIHSTEELLLYDLSLKNGTHIALDNGSFSGYYNVKVDSTINLCHKRLQDSLYDEEGNLPSIQWIEGIGSTRGFLYTHIFNGSLLSVKENDVKVYDKNDYNPLGIGCTNLENILPTNEISDQTGLTIFPNPVTDHVTVQQNEIINSIEILDLCGHELAQYKPDQNSYNISLTNFNSGMYLIKVGSVINKLIIK